MEIKLAMRFIFILILLSSTSMQLRAANHFPVQHNRDSITTNKLISDIAKENIYESDAEKNAQSLQAKRGDLLKNESPFELLTICMENQNAVVRLYAFKALADKMDNLPVEAVIKFKNDTTPVTIQTVNGKKQLPVWQIANGFLK